MSKINIKVNSISYHVEGGGTILSALKEIHIHVPTLCFLKDINEIGACRMCMVEVKGAKNLQASCVTEVRDGMEIYTHSHIVQRARKEVLSMILSAHDRKCLTCSRKGVCELMQAAHELGIDVIEYDGYNPKFELDLQSPAIVRDNNKCITCRRCVSVCSNVQNVYAIQPVNRGFETIIGSIYDKSLNETSCIMCGQCIMACPTGALKERSEIDDVWTAILDPELHVVVQTAPAVRVAIGEEFGMPVGTIATGKMVTALRKLGFDKVFDTNTGADLTIMEEGYELLSRIQKGGKLPMITSCSPGWIKYCEHNFHDFLDNLSSCKSPHQMLGAMLKSYYAEVAGIDPSKIFVVSVMPCTAKKYEKSRPEMEVYGHRDVDAVVTTRELANMIKQTGINFAMLPDSEFDNPLGMATGAGAIFGATGGVMEAAIRTVAHVLSNGQEDIVEFESCRGKNNNKEFNVTIGDVKVRGVVVHGTGNAKDLLKKIKDGEVEYDFIEIMGCTGGCITGGGQPIVSARDGERFDVWTLRKDAIYQIDKDLPLRKSHENPFIIKLYDEFLDKPNSHKAHKYLHTHYTRRHKYTNKNSI
ncbi:MAG: NADH-dependent [FeFe] hydrogenase, group A6 [Lachnospirales bacterium]